MKSLRTAVTLAVLTALAATARLSADDAKFDHAGLYEKCVRSSVFIVTPLKGGSAQGSGSLIDAEKRYVITNYHVVDETETVFVQFPVRNKDGTLMTDKKKYVERIPAGQALKGKVLFRDRTRDLALLQLDRLPPDTHAIPLSKTSAKVGDSVINIGNPGAVDWTFSTTQGTVRGVGVANWAVGGGGETLRLKARMVTVTNPINPGDSGGPLIDHRGYQIGVTESSRGGAQNVNSGVDISEVWAFLEEKKITIKDLTKEDGAPPKRKEVEAKGKKLPGALDRDPPGGNGPGTTPPEQGTTPPEKKSAGPVVEPGPGAPTPAMEKDADTALRQAKVFKDSDDKDYYANKLKSVISKYPGTRAAKEAKTLLDGMK